MILRCMSVVECELTVLWVADLQSSAGQRSWLESCWLTAESVLMAHYSHCISSPHALGGDRRSREIPDDRY